MPAEKQSPPTRSLEGFVIRPTERADARRIQRMVRESGVLEVNSCYAYLLLCEHFGDTCLVAESAAAGFAAGRGLAGFVTAYRPPSRPQSVFVWQVGVAPLSRKRGLAKQLLLELIKQPRCRDAKFLEATVAPSNLASQCLFACLAEELGVGIECVEGFAMTDFGDASEGGHEAEPIYRIGPLPLGRSSPEES